ncbi:MAG: hypothetical protein NVS1B11_01760 [Terriglobales bacterium]
MYRVAFFILIVSLLSGDSIAAKKKQESPSASFPETLLRALPQGERFSNPQYFDLMAGSGILKTDAKAVFTVVCRPLRKQEKNTRRCTSRGFFLA